MMHWNRKMRSLRRWTLRHVVKFMIDKAHVDRREKRWLAERLAKIAGCPSSMAEGEMCRVCKGDALVSQAGCWLLAAEDAVINESGRSSHER